MTKIDKKNIYIDAQQQQKENNIALIDYSVISNNEKEVSELKKVLKKFDYVYNKIANRKIKNRS